MEEPKEIADSTKDDGGDVEIDHGQLPKSKSKSKVRQWLIARSSATWENLTTNCLWQRVLKNTIATTTAVIIALIPAVINVYGKATYLAPITTVFGHPGRRFGQMAEALVLAILGTLLGTAWSTFGIYLSSLLYESNPPAAYTVKAIFLVVVVLLHGFLRSHTPRLFIMVLLMIIVSVVSLTGTSNTVSATLITTLLYPILTASGILLIVNVCVYPEFSSSFLGITTIETLGDTVGALRDAGTYFMYTTDLTEAPKQKDPELIALPSRSTTAAEIPDENSLSHPKPSSLVGKIIATFRKKNEQASETGSVKSDGSTIVNLKSLTDAKSKLRSKLDSCKAAQQECNFELAWAVLPPRDLKPISDTAMKKLVANTIALIGACESKYALMGDLEHQFSEGQSQSETKEAKAASRKQSLADESGIDETDHEKDGDGKPEKGKKGKGKTKLEREIADLERVKPRKEIEFGDIELLRLLVTRISQPLADLQRKIDRSVDVVNSCLAYCYDVHKLPDGSRPPTGIKLEEIDVWADNLTSAIAEFDRDTASALEGAAAIHDLENPQIDIMPRMETFLISSFLLNLREAALQTHVMLAHSRKLVEMRQSRCERRRIYAPRINWRKWLTSGGEEDMAALPSKGRKDARTGTVKDNPETEDSATTSKENLLRKADDEEAASKMSELLPEPPIKQTKSGVKRSKSKTTRSRFWREAMADTIDYLKTSEDTLYSLKLTIAVFLVTWPAFLADWNMWYSLNRGLWAALQLVLITEVAIGNSIFVFVLRAIGTTLGCLWGYAAYEARNGNRVVCVVLLAIGIIPSAYVQLGTKYVKAGMVSIISMCVVALATVDQTVPGTASETFWKRLIAFLIGGIVALTIEFTVFPVKARERLVESLAASIRHISEMEACLAYGIESESNVDVHSSDVSDRFESAKSKAESALTAAETFLPFCSQEPRLKGSFAGLALVYTEILYVLHQIVDKMDNMLQLRREYGSGVLEELNVQVYPYRRNVAGSITLVLFAVHEALTTKLPLPQFLPSARLAHLRMVNRVREVVMTKVVEPREHIAVDGDRRPNSTQPQIGLSLVKRIVRQKFLSWNAASAGQTEVIEYLEELIDLTKLLVGANEFRSGLLTRPTYRDYVDQIGKRYQGQESHDQTVNNTVEEREQDELRDAIPEARRRQLVKKGTGTDMDRQTTQQQTSAKMDELGELKRRRQVEKEELPRSLQRVRTRRAEERMGKPEQIPSQRRAM